MALLLIGCKIFKFKLDSSYEKVGDLEIFNSLNHRKEQMLYKISFYNV
jgi:hypothetical protein